MYLCGMLLRVADRAPQLVVIAFKLKELMTNQSDCHYGLSRFLLIVAAL